MLHVALTHDIDRIRKTYQTLTHSFRRLRDGGIVCALRHLYPFDRDAYWNFPKIIELEGKYKVKSTFFFLNESIRFNPFKISTWPLSLGRYRIHEARVVNMIRWLDQNGWEIGVHGSYNSYDKLNLLSREKLELETIVGHQIIGIRQHNLNLNDNTWRLQKQAGFKFDSSYGFNDRIGYKDERFKPFRPFGDEFVVFPTVIMDTCFMAHPDKWRGFLEIVSSAQQRGSLLVINWHNVVFSERDFPGFCDTYVLIIEELQRRESRFYTLSQYYANLTRQEGR